MDCEVVGKFSLNSAAAIFKLLMYKPATVTGFSAERERVNE
jgi:hypothetical protein